MAVLGLQPLKFAVVTIRLAFSPFSASPQIEANLLNFGAIVSAGLRLIRSESPNLRSQPPDLCMRSVYCSCATVRIALASLSEHQVS